MKSRPLAARCGPFAAVFLLVCAGCYTPSVESLTGQYGYHPDRSPVRIDASATVEVTATMTPELEARLGTGEYHDHYLRATAALIEADVTGSDLFAQMRPAGGRADYRIVVTSEESHPSGYRLRVRLQAFDAAATGKAFSDHTREASGPILMGLNFDPKHPALKEIMAGLKADLAADVQQRLRQRQQQQASDDVQQFARASLVELLSGIDRSTLLATARNHALIAAKNEQLPGLLRDSSTGTLKSLVVQVEQTILDLDHEGEMAKDRAQQVAAANGEARELDELRGLAISYRERIELLKPMLAALKDEIANRNR